jgi:UDP-N-acetylmuramoyl-tripeptide--D-alanyl-D-alanine ligase
MIAGLDTLELIKVNGNKIAVIGDMRELGDASEEEHTDILNYASKKADFVLAFGVEMNKAFKKLELKNTFSFLDKNELLNKLLEFKLSSSAILVKGSRGTKMEDIIIGLKEKYKN